MPPSGTTHFPMSMQPGDRPSTTRCAAATTEPAPSSCSRDEPATTLLTVTADLETSAIGTTNAITVAGSATALGEGTDSFTGVNAVQGSMFGDTLLGSSFSNTLIGLGGDDYLDGRGGFDTAGYNSLSTVTGGANVNLAAGGVRGGGSGWPGTRSLIAGTPGPCLARPSERG